MKKILVSLLVLMIAGTCMAYPSAGDAKTTFRNGFAWGGHVPKDRATLWAQGIEGQISGLGTGKIWYVDSGATSPGAGTTWNEATLTLDEIFALITTDGGASRGDVVKIAEYHAENLDSQGVDSDVIGVTVIGMGAYNSTAMPSFTYTDQDGEFAVGADNNVFVNLRFVPSTSVIAKAIDVEAGADYTQFINCIFAAPEDKTNDEFLIGINLNPVTGTTIRECRFDVGAAAADCAIKLTGKTFDVTIADNTIMGDYATSCIRGITTLSERLLITGNILWNGVTSGINAQPVIELLTGTVGIAKGNYGAGGTTAATAYAADAMMMFGNYYTETTGGTKTALSIDLAAATTATLSVTVSSDD